MKFKESAESKWQRGYIYLWLGRCVSDIVYVGRFICQ